MTSVSNAYPCLVPLSYLSTIYIGPLIMVLRDKRIFYCAHVRKQLRGHVSRIFLHEVTAYLTSAKVGEKCVLLKDTTQ